MLDKLNKFKADFAKKKKETDDLLEETNPKKLRMAPALGEVTPFAIPGAATSVIKSVAELVNLFRTDTQFQNKTVAISDDMVVSYLVDYFARTRGRTSQPDMYYPAIFPPSLFTNQTKSPLIIALSDISGARG